MSFYAVDLERVLEIYERSGVANLPEKEFDIPPSALLKQVYRDLNLEVEALLVDGELLEDAYQLPRYRALNALCFRFHNIIRPDLPPAPRPALERTPLRWVLRRAGTCS